MKIAIFGLGGVGGYLAAQATAYYSDREDIEFYYIARGKHLEAIKRDGLRLERDECEAIVAHAKLATDNAAECGVVDYVIYATKSYSIDANIESLKAITDEQSVVVTFMNGVDGAQRLRSALPEVCIAEGCVFIYSQIASAGIIRESGGFAQYQLGGTEPRVRELYELLSPAVDRVTYHEDIAARIWGKFSYISPYATISTQHNIVSDEIVNNEEYHTIYKALCDEFAAVAAALGIDLGFDVYENNMKLVQLLPSGTTSSMQRDYHSGKQSEMASLTTYISATAKELSIPTPHYDTASREL